MTEQEAFKYLLSEALQEISETVEELDRRELIKNDRGKTQICKHVKRKNR